MMIQRQWDSPSCELKLREGDDGQESRDIEGWAIRFNEPSAVLYSDGSEEFREIIDPAAITDEVLRASDIRMTLFHNNQMLLARSKKGKGSLRWERSDKGVKFIFTAPHTVDGDKAVELVRAGTLDGCSFAFTTRYGDAKWVERTSETKSGKVKTMCRVMRVGGIFDFTLTDNPAYPTTSVKSRELVDALHASDVSNDDAELNERVALTVKEMREKASYSII